MSTALGWINAGSNLLNALGGAGGKAAQAGEALSGLGPVYVNNDADFSGFTVATGKARADGAQISKTSADQTPGGAAPGALGGVSPWLWAAGIVAGALAWRSSQS